MESKKKQSGSILVVDDEGSLRDTFHFFLSRAGYEPVLTVATFEEALVLLRNQPIDLVLSDIVLEGRSGIDLLKHARQLDINCPFIIITGFPDVDTAAEAVRLGAFDYISKPIDKETLLKSVKFALRHRKLQKEMELILNSAGEGIFGLDTDGNVTFANTSALLMIGWERDDIIGKPHHELVHHSHADNTKHEESNCPIRQAYEDGIVHSCSEDVFWTKEGTSFPVEYVSTPIIDNSHVCGAVVVFRDTSTFT